ncbi:hypothetical protein CRE_19413 [Caenorhabditis remanei]|uniref:ubiquitinyl hydrolase 1 n=1 Tax=Caenorhabditis remanei TaxID=31234 RepID=E3N9Z0_CAERE|nr:hypothetical protein CRE_19413 [Caenorhabditis remanei]
MSSRFVWRAAVSSSKRCSATEPVCSERSPNEICGDQEMHNHIRALCVAYISKHRDFFKGFITEDYENYIRRKRENHVHGNHVELQAISEIFARPVEVYKYSDEPVSVHLPRPEPGVSGSSGGNSGEAGTSSSSSSAPPLQQQIRQNPPLQLSYDGYHYNAKLKIDKKYIFEPLPEFLSYLSNDGPGLKSFGPGPARQARLFKVLAPHIATIGVGLGLPGMIPGAADKDLMTKAIATSELEHLEETMLQDKIDMTDYQRTQANIEDQTARESLMSYLKDLERDSGALDDGPSTSSAVATSSGAAAAGGASGLYEELLSAQSLVSVCELDDTALNLGFLLSLQQSLMDGTAKN